jgi:hypothetical protein
MNRRLAALALIVACALAPTGHGAGKAGDATSLTFHLETENSENPKLIFSQEIDGTTRYFKRMPEISTRDLVSFSPFPADDEVSYGIVFQLSNTATRRLNAITTSNQGRWLIAQTNGRIVDGVVIDQPVGDGFIVIWQGVSLRDIEMMDASLPRFGAKKPKKK